MASPIFMFSDGGKVELRLEVFNKSGSPLTYATDGSAAIDLRACLDSARHLPVGRRFKFDTGIHVAIPDGFVGLVQPRSGLAYKHGIVAITGVIDSDYRGEVGVTLVNLGTETYVVEPGDRIGQFMIVPCQRAKVVEVASVDALGATARGDGGFGSTGR